MKWLTIVLALLIKFGGKLFPLLLKVVGSKAGLAALSIGSYSLIFTWEFALMLLSMLFLHELGHLLTMKKFGMKTKGIYLIPFLGAAAVFEGDFPSHFKSVIVSLAGPFVGFVLALLTLSLYYQTQNPIFAAATSWMALVNLLNLLPIMPLDGGRVIGAICYSIKSRLGFFILIALFILGIAYCVHERYWLFVAIGGIGIFELYTRYRDRFSRPQMDLSGITTSAILWIGLIFLLYLLMNISGSIPGAETALHFIRE